MKLKKCLMPGIINISNEFIYKSFDFRNFNSLSFFLFNLYLSEFDFYVFGLCYQFNFKHLLYESYTKNLFPIQKKLLLISPLKLNKNRLFTFSNEFSYLKSSNLSFNFCLERKISYVRYLDFFFLGIAASKIFCIKVKNRLMSFLKGNLFLNLETCNLFSVFENNIYFIGYNIISSRKLNYFENKSEVRKVDKVIFNRLFFHKMNFSKIYLNRFYMELGELHNKIVFSNNSNSVELIGKRIWTQLLQLEAVRSFQLNKIFLSKNNLEFFDFLKKFKDLKTKNLFFFKNYSFNIFLSQIRRSLKEKLFSQSFLSFKSLIFSSDLFLNLLFNNFVKNYFFLFQISCSYKQAIIQSKRSFFLFKTFSNNNFLFSKSDILVVNKAFFESKNTFYKSFSFNLYMPVNKVQQKLKNLGFIDYFTNRSIANVNYMFLEDFFLIKFFGAFCFSLLNWYTCADNIEKLNFLIELIKKSCFLTLSRKHNKSKSWSYEVYSYDLLFLKNIFIAQSYFPTKKLIFKVKNYSLFEYNAVLFDELIFLNL